MAESFVKTMMRDYIRHMPKPGNGPAQPSHRLEHYNEEHPHGALTSHLQLQRFVMARSPVMRT